MRSLAKPTRLLTRDDVTIVIKTKSERREGVSLWSSAPGRWVADGEYWQIEIAGELFVVESHERTYSDKPLVKARPAYSNEWIKSTGVLGDHWTCIGLLLQHLNLVAAEGGAR